MINNRQAGRRRGRGGQRAPGGGGRPDGGNRIDNRARGNASQLLEKYRNLARDAQMQGDRVNTEYYLQFADHYFRVLNEGRPRDEQPRRLRDDYDDEDGDYDAQDGGDEQPRAEQRQDRGDRQQDRSDRQQERGDRQQDRGDRQERAQREGRDQRPDRGEPRRRERYVPPVEGEGEGAPVQADAPAEDRPRRTRRPRVTDEGAEPQGFADQSIADILPPAIAQAEPTSDDEPAPRPRRTRRPRAEANDDGTPAAA